MLFDLHVHTTISPCSTLPLETILDHARSRGLDGVCLTDHDTMAARNLVREGAQPDGLVVVVGMEYATPQGDYLIFGPFEELAPGLPAQSMLRIVAKAGGAAVVAHPCRENRPADESLAAANLVHSIETANGRNTARENQHAEAWVARFGLPACAGSDAHTLDELGRMPTRFTLPVTDRASLVRALRQGACTPARPLPQAFAPAELSLSA